MRVSLRAIVLSIVINAAAFYVVAYLAWWFTK